MAIDHHKPQVFSPFWEEGRLPIPYLAGSMSIYLEGNSYDPNYSTVMAMVVYHPHITHLRIFEEIFWRTFFLFDVASVLCFFWLDMHPRKLNIVIEYNFHRFFLIFFATRHLGGFIGCFSSEFGLIGILRERFVINCARL